jgi:hypothetical protein
MKTAKSNIKNEFKRAQNTFADVGTTYLKDWTQKQLTQYKNTPVIIPAGDHGFFVGTYHVIGIDKDRWQVEQQDGRYIHEFTSRLAAIVYCVNSIKQQHTEAQKLLDLDAKIGRLEMNIMHYEYTLAQHQDSVKHGVVLNRCIDAKMQRRALINILKKSLNSAKYLNFGNQPL